MFYRGTRPGLATRHASSHGVCRVSLSGVAILVVGIALLGSREMDAQRGGGGGGGTSLGGGAGRPGGVSEKDDLKNFHRAMAVQATPEQRAAFTQVAKDAQATSDQLRAFRESLQKATAASRLSDRAAALDQALERARGSSRNFLASLSSRQKSDLQDTTRKLEKADSELDKQIKTLDQIVQLAKAEPEQVSSVVASLDKALAGFQNEQLALGREVSVLFPPAGEGVTFSLPVVTNSINIAGQAVSIRASGAVSRRSAEPGQSIFSLKIVTDLSDLQHSFAGILRSQLNRSPGCGERIEILQATLTPLAPASLVVAKLHLERWVCPSGPGHGGAMEVASGEANIEIKLTPALEPTSGLHLVSEITRVEAQGFLRASLRSGDLGTSVREQIAASVLSALKQGADLNTTLPLVAQESAIVQKAEFQDAGADQLNLVLDGQLQFSDEQAQQFAAQIKQRLSALGASGQGTTPP